MEISPNTYIGAVNLSVSDLEKAGDYYRRVLGLQLIHGNRQQFSFSAP